MTAVKVISRQWRHVNYIGLHNIDIDECELLNGGCEQKCLNADGTFLCQCYDGYNLNQDGLHCDGGLPVLNIMDA